MITGKYIVKSGDTVIGEYPNMITTNGLTVVNQYLSGQLTYWGDTIAIGALSSSSTTASTKKLQYEILRYPVGLKSYQTSGSVNQLILKATVDPTAVFEAYEIGVVPAKVNTLTYKDNYSITSFSELSGSVSQWNVGGSPVVSSSTSPTPRVGALQIPLTVSTTASINTASIGGLAIDSTRYTGVDFTHILYYCSTDIPSASVTVTYGDSSASQLLWSGSSTISSVASGTFYSVEIDMQQKPEAFTDPINTVSITFYGASGSLNLDHMKFVLNDNLTTDQQLISRTTSASPLFSKAYSQPMEIEYYIQVT